MYLNVKGGIVVHVVGISMLSALARKNTTVRVTWERQILGNPASL